MKNKELWDSLFQELDEMSDEEFLILTKELEVHGDIPFAIGEFNNEPLSLNGVDTGIYHMKSVYNNQSQYNIGYSLDEEMAA